MFKLVVLHLTKLEVILEPNDETNLRELELCIKIGNVVQPLYNTFLFSLVLLFIPMDSST